MQINTNVSAMITQNYLRQSNLGLEQSMERLSSGKRINSAADDAAGLAIATRMNSKIRGMEVGIRNTNDGMSLVQTAESALGSITNILQRMRDLAVQSSNGTNTTTDRASLNTEFAALRTEIDHIADNTTFNGIKIADGTNASVAIQLSDVANDTLTVTLTDVNTAVIGGATKVSAALVDSEVNAQAAVGILDTAIGEISNARAGYGATLNRLSFNVDNITSQKNNLAESKSRIEDADMAAEVSEMTKFKVLAQSGMSMLSQANQNPQMVLKLLG